ncbi:RecQ family ATP-dependent DNA helicase [Vibrio breoganii]
MSKTPLQVLKETWGYDSFRDGQESIIDAVIAGRDGVALMATGGGKSLCFQVPALALDGTCIVISPLIALMRDQVEALNNKGAKATYINSSIEKEEAESRILNLADNQYDLVYVAPERLDDPVFLSALVQANISFCAIDEAHLASEWGHDFRRAYTRIDKNLKKVEEQQKKRIQRFGYTATATPDVLNDITGILDLNDPYIQSDSFDTPHITPHIVKTKNKSESLAILADKHRGESMIIYTATIKNCEKIATTLRARGMNTSAYHGKLDNQYRSKIQDAFLNNEIDVIVATSAFGMGVDKPNIRSVVFYDMPGDIESWVQGIGRVSRDRQRGDGYMLVTGDDRFIPEIFIANAFPKVEYILAVRNALFANLGYDQALYMTHDDVIGLCNDVLRDSKVNKNLPASYIVEPILNVLEEQGIIELKRTEDDYNGYDIAMLDPVKAIDVDYIERRKVHKYDQLGKMVRLASTTTCLRAPTLSHFGEAAPTTHCGNCGNCLTIEREMENRFAYNEKDIHSVLSLIESKPHLTHSKLTEVLIGRESPRNIRAGFDGIPQFGDLKGMTSLQCKKMVQYLEGEGLINKLNDTAYELTKEGFNLFDEAKNPKVEIVKEQQLNSTPKYDPDLHARLQEVRALLALNSNRPELSVAENQSLTVMATYKPTTVEALKDKRFRLTSEKIKLFGKQFIDAINDQELDTTVASAPEEFDANLTDEQAMQYAKAESQLTSFANSKGLALDLIISKESLRAAITNEVTDTEGLIATAGMLRRRAKKYSKQVLSAIGADIEENHELEP